MNIKIKNRKIYLAPIIIIIILITMPILLFVLINRRNILYIEWKIFLPRPNNIDVIYNYIGREGEDFEVWHYNYKKTEKLINHRKFRPVDTQFLKKKVEKYFPSYDILIRYYSKDERNAINQFKEKVNNLVLDRHNYYAYITRKELYDDKLYVDHLLLILDTKENNLYLFKSVGSTAPIDISELI